MTNVGRPASSAWRARRPTSVAAARIDEEGPSAGELHVIGAGVAQDEAAPERRRLQVECEERGVAKLAEAPLIGVRHKWHALRLDHGVRTLRQCE